jgi:hypothetical protein
MSKNTAKIRAGLKALTAKYTEILSGVVVGINETDATISVLVTGHEDPVEEVKLNAVSNNNNGWIIYPDINSDVIIGCIDGPGEYTLLRASNITKAIITIGNQVFTMDGNKYGLVTGAESLGKIMSDLMDKMLAMTFTNGAGTTSPANNSTDLSNIKTRLNNFLTS